MDNDRSERIRKYLAGDATEEERERLRSEVESDPDLMAEIFAAAEIERDLHDVLSRDEHSVPHVRTPRAARRWGRRDRAPSASPLIIAVGAAAVILFGLILVVSLPSGDGSGPVVSAPPAQRVAPAPAPRPLEKLPSAPRDSNAPPAPGAPSPTPSRERNPGAPKAELPVPPPGKTPAPPPKSIPPTPVPPLKPTKIAVASIEDVRGRVFLLDGTPARAGQPLEVSQGIRTGGPESRAVLAFPDGTRVELGSEASLDTVTLEKGKRLTLSRGRLVATVAKQPANEPMVLKTPRGTARVLGTRLVLEVTEESTLLEVLEGRVRLTRSKDRRSIDVRAGYYALAAEGVRLVARPIAGRTLLRSDFRTPQETAQTWRTYTSGPADRTATAQGVLRMTLSNDKGQWEDWYASTRRSFAVSDLKISAKVRLSDAFGNLVAGVSLYDEADSGKGDRDHIEVLVGRNTVTYRSLRYGNGGSKNAANIELATASRPNPVSSGQWIPVEFRLDPENVAITVNGALLYTGPHRVTNLRRVRVGLLGGLKTSAGPHTVEFDEVVVERAR